MGDLDEISCAIGGLEATQEAMLIKQTEQGKKIDKIEDAVVDQKVRSAYIAGGIGVGSSATVLLLKEKGAAMFKFFFGGF